MRITLLADGISISRTPYAEAHQLSSRVVSASSIGMARHPPEIKSKTLAHYCSDRIGNSIRSRRKSQNCLSGDGQHGGRSLGGNDTVRKMLK